MTSTNDIARKQQEIEEQLKLKHNLQSEEQQLRSWERELHSEEEGQRINALRKQLKSDEHSWD